MADNTNDSNSDEECINETGSDKSFVGKFVSGLISNTPLSKWFKSNNNNSNNSITKQVIRRRGDGNYDDEDDEDSFIVQPPVKRAKLPNDTILKTTINDLQPQRNNFTTTPSKIAQSNNNNNNNNNVKIFNSFLEPIPGPSGIQKRKLFDNIDRKRNDPILNSNIDEQNDTDDSEEESTSDYSSSAPLKANIVHETTKAQINIRQLNKEDLNTQAIDANLSINKDSSSRTNATIRTLFNNSQDGNRSLFSECSLSPNINRNVNNTSLSSRRPNFNPSIPGTLNFVDKTLTTKRILNSPFYSGRTMYGGASSLNLNALHAKLNDNRSKSVVIKPTNQKLNDDNTTLSKTARRILNTLEQYSTPISDAKKIPISPKNDDKMLNTSRTNRGGILTKYIGVNPYILRAKSLPSNKELQIPDLLQMKQKERLQNSTENVRQIAITSKSDLNKEEYKLAAHIDNNNDNKEKPSKHTKHINKIKNNSTSVRQNKIQIIENELINPVKLPNVKLPITTLPKFDFVIPPPPVAAVAAQQPISEKLEKINDYQFSKPLIISENFKAIQAINCFKFSEPVDKKQKLVTNNLNFKMPEIVTKPIPKLKNNGENCLIKPAPELKTTGSCVDILTSSNLDKFKPSKDTWECTACLVRNSNDKSKCIACETEREKSTNNKQNLSSFGDKFKPLPTTWECPTCMIRNKNELTKCEACQTDNPNNKKSTTVPSTPTFNFGIKPTTETWECSSCWVRNKNDTDKCIACETVRNKSQTTSTTVQNQQQSSWGDKFKSLQTWECPTCMIRNKNDLNKCEACETLKPNKEQSKTTFKFGINNDWECKLCKLKNTTPQCQKCGNPKDANNVNNGFGDRFKLKQCEWECESCLVRNKDDVVKCACCGTLKAGCNDDINTSNITTEKTTVSFNFGIDNKQNSFKFGIPSTTTTITSQEQTTITTSAPSFTFGVPNKTTTVATTATTNSNSSNFGIKPQTEDKTSENNNEEKSSTTTLPTFKFGVDTSTTPKTNETATIPKKIEVPASLSADSVAKKPTFDFKPVNGDINKPNLFASTTTTTTTTTTTSSPASNIFGAKPSTVVTTASMPTFKFGSTTTPAAIVTATTTASVTATVTSTSSSGMFKFGSANIQSTAISSTKRSFGDVSSSSENKASFSNRNGFGSTTPTTSSATKLPTFDLPKTASFGGSSTTDNKPINFGTNNSTVTKSTTSFGGSSADNKTISFIGNNNSATTKSLSFGTTSTTTTTSMSSSSGFGSMANTTKFGTSVDSTKTSFSSTVSENKPFSFGNTDTNKTINFGNVDQNKTISFGGNSEQKPVTGFGLNNNSFVNTNETKLTGFGGLSNATKPTFGVTETKPLIPNFATTDNKTTFGSTSSSTIIETKPNIFGNTDTKPTSFSNVSTTGQKPIFGASEPIKPFSFGNPTTVNAATTNETKPTSFTFGQQPQQQQENKLNEATPQSFKFGGNATNTSNTSGFNFSITPNTTFNFGNNTTKTETVTQPAQNQGIFGGSSISNNNNINSTSSGNNNNHNNSGTTWAKTGSFNFGTAANNNNQKAIFTFGASQTTNPTSFTAQSASNTAAVPAAPPTVPQQTTGFNFGASAPTPGGFNFTGAMPNFNFTDGAANTAQPQRKLRRALRRIHR